MHTTDDFTSFQILIDDTNFKQYSIGNIAGKYKIQINNIKYLNTGNHDYIIRIKSNALQYDVGSPTNDILFIHRDGSNDLINPIVIDAVSLPSQIDFTITNYSTGNAPAGFTAILLDCRAYKC